MSGPGRDAAAAWQIASLLLDYPDEAWRARLPMLAAEVGRLPQDLVDPLRAFVNHAARTDPTSLAADFVATFDLKRRCCLYLTYYAHGDTRNRGMALLAFKTAYRRAGVVLGDDELPDHLAVVLEFAATADPAAGYRLLVDHRAGLELLRMALRDEGSPWVKVLDAVSATLPKIRGDEQEAVRRLAAQGPPAEEVGLSPFGPPTTRDDLTGARR